VRFDGHKLEIRFSIAAAVFQRHDVIRVGDFPDHDLPA
jgi:hypothetical protein